MIRTPLSRRLALAAATALVTASLSGPAAAALPEAWQTVAERSDFQATSSYDETIDLLQRLDQASPAIELSSFGRSGEGRPLPLVVVSADHAFTPAAAAATGKPIVVIQSCIHAGEVDGKDASLMMLRDWAVGRRALPRNVIVLLAPIYNADGHERMSPYNRPNQDGPAAGMGVRTTAAGIDLNRDHLRLASPEARAVIGLLEDLARAMLTDPEVAAAWQEALEDEAFAADRTARYLWWYRRTPYWDEQVGLMPVVRVTTTVPMAIAPWPGE